MSKLTQREKEMGWCEEAQTYCSIAEDSYQQGRKDAIDEILKSDLCEHDEDWHYPCITPSYLWERLMQLKEQNHE